MGNWIKVYEKPFSIILECVGEILHLRMPDRGMIYKCFLKLISYLGKPELECSLLIQS
jgi:hypothetical protein